MSVPSEAAVREILEDFHVRLRTVVDGAWAEWIAIEWRGKLVYEPRARAVLVFDFIARRAREEFAADANIHVLAQKQTVKFMFKDQVVIRFKKGNAKGVGSNIETQAVLDFIDPQRTIPGLIPEIMKVEVCWNPDDLGIDLSEVAVVARDKNKRLWAYGLDRAAPAAEVVPLRPRTPDPTPPQIVPRVAPPKEGEKDDE
jgi:hypothetical protein